MYYIIDFAAKLSYKNTKEKDKQAAMSHDMLTNKVIPVPWGKKYQIQVPNTSTSYMYLPVCQSLVTSLIVYR